MIFKSPVMSCPFGLYLNGGLGLWCLTSLSTIYQIPIIQLNKSMGSNATSLFSDPGIAEPLLFTTNLLLFLQIKSLTTSFLYIKTIKTKLYCASLFLLTTFISSNFPVFPLYEVYISQYIIIGLVHTCRSQLLTQKYSYNDPSAPFFSSSIFGYWPQPIPFCISDLLIASPLFSTLSKVFTKILIVYDLQIFRNVVSIWIIFEWRFRFMVFNITFNNISVISWWSVLLVDVDVYCRTSALITSKLNLLIVLATILHSNVHGEVHSIQHYVKKFVSGFLRVLRPFHPPIKLTTTI
jgi:hypothetical protein